MLSVSKISGSFMIIEKFKNFLFTIFSQTIYYSLTIFLFVNSSIIKNFLYGNIKIQISLSYSLELKNFEAVVPAISFEIPCSLFDIQKSIFEFIYFARPGSTLDRPLKFIQILT
jgi:hypothetical protein